jgi:hypothetical protein
MNIDIEYYFYPTTYSYAPKNGSRNNWLKESMLEAMLEAISYRPGLFLEAKR